MFISASEFGENWYENGVLTAMTEARIVVVVVAWAVIIFFFVHFNYVHVFTPLNSHQKKPQRKSHTYKRILYFHRTPFGINRSKEESTLHYTIRVVQIQKTTRNGEANTKIAKLKPAKREKNQRLSILFKMVAHEYIFCVSFWAVQLYLYEHNFMYVCGFIVCITRLYVG